MSELTLEFLHYATILERDVQAVESLLALLHRGKSRESKATLEFVRTNARENTVVVARGLEGSISGMATLVVNASNEGLWAWIEDVVVAESYQGKGYARKMMCMLHAHARERGADLIFLTSNERRVAAHALYKSLGYEPYDTTVFSRSF